MSELRINNITDRAGSSGPIIAGVSTVTSTSHMVMPSGPTEMRGGRGTAITLGGYTDPATSNIIDKMTIATTGNAVDFGDVTAGRYEAAAVGSATRGIASGGAPSTFTIDYVIFSSGGGGYEFGELRTAVRMNCGASDSVRGLSFGGLKSPGSSNNFALDTINYINIASGGTDQDFGSSSLARRAGKATASSTRAVHFIGGYQYGAAATNVIEYVTIQTTGDAIDFGDLTVTRVYPTSVSNGHGGLG